MVNDKLVLEIIKDLHELVDSIEILLQEMRANSVTSEPEIKVPKAESISIEKVRAVLAEKSQSGKQPEVKALIIKYGANKLTDINPECYAELLKEAEVL